MLSCLLTLKPVTCSSGPTCPSWLAPLSEDCIQSVDDFSLQQGQIQLKVLFVFLWLAGCTCQLDFGISSQFWLAPARSLVKSKLCCTVMQSLKSKWCRARGRWFRRFRLYHQFLRKSCSSMYGLWIPKGFALGLPLIWLYINQWPLDSQGDHVLADI